jgi:hypothetical protein
VGQQEQILELAISKGLRLMWIMQHASSVMHGVTWNAMHFQLLK